VQRSHLAEFSEIFCPTSNPPEVDQNTRWEAADYSGS
jgi:hypothetical protein